MPDWSIKFIPAKNPKPNQTADFVLSAPGNPTGPFSEHQAGAQHPPGQRPRAWQPHPRAGGRAGGNTDPRV